MRKLLPKKFDTNSYEIHVFMVKNYVSTPHKIYRFKRASIRKEFVKVCEKETFMKKALVTWGNHFSRQQQKCTN